MVFICACRNVHLDGGNRDAGRERASPPRSSHGIADMKTLKPLWLQESLLVSQGKKKNTDVTAALSKLS